MRNDRKRTEERWRKRGNGRRGERKRKKRKGSRRKKVGR